jgi:hypothetical protein
MASRKDRIVLVAAPVALLLVFCAAAWWITRGAPGPKPQTPSPELAAAEVGHTLDVASGAPETPDQAAALEHEDRTAALPRLHDQVKIAAFETDGAQREFAHHAPVPESARGFATEEKLKLPPGAEVIVDVEFDELVVQAALHAIGLRAGLNIVVEGSPHEPVTLDIGRVSAHQALHLICEQCDLVLELRDNVYFITKRKE